MQDLETVTPEEAAQRIRDAEALAKMAAHERIQAERRNLPMYKFRTELKQKTMKHFLLKSDKRNGCKYSLATTVLQHHTSVVQLVFT